MFKMSVITSKTIESNEDVRSIPLPIPSFIGLCAVVIKLLHPLFTKMTTPNLYQFFINSSKIFIDLIVAAIL